MKKIIMPEEQVKEYMSLTDPKERDRIRALEDIAKSFIRDKIKHISYIVENQKYDKSAWLNQYNKSVGHSKSDRRIDEICKDLGYISRNLSEDQKAEVGFWLLMDYLRDIHTEYLKAKSCVSSTLVYKNISRTGEVIHLFSNPLTIKDLEEAYKAHRKYLSAIGAGYQSQLKDADEELKVKLNKDISCNKEALLDLKDLYNLLKNNWEKKVCPLSPWVDDRKLKDLPIENEVLKALAVKEDGNLSVGLKELILPSERAK